MRHLLGSIILLMVCFAMSGPAWSEPEIVVSAAISLKNAFTDIGKLYEEGHPGVKVNFNFGAKSHPASKSTSISGLPAI